MLKSTKELHGDTIAALDGELGSVKDFYFDDQLWAVRYVVVETGKWLTNQQVLLSTRAFGDQYPTGKTLLVNLTRKQIEGSPVLEWHKPISRKFEMEYHHHYGWAPYWQDDALLGMNEFPVIEAPVKIQLDEPVPASASGLDETNSHLCSMQTVRGYHLHASDGIIGHVADFLIDDCTWTIRQLVVKTGHRITGREVQVPTGKVDRISYKESTIFVNMTGEAVEECPNIDQPGRWR